MLVIKILLVYTLSTYTKPGKKSNWPPESLLPLKTKMKLLLSHQDLMDKEQSLNSDNTPELNLPQPQDGHQELLQTKILNNSKNQKC